MTKREKGALALAMALCALAGVGAALANSGTGEAVSLPNAAGGWTIPADSHSEPLPVAPVSVEIRGVGTFTCDPARITSARPDLFVDGRFSAFDALAALGAQGAIDLRTSYDDAQATYAIQSINGLAGWWYDVRLPGGTLERTALRMDTYPLKDGAVVYLYLEEPARLAAIEASFRDEVARRTANGGRVVVPTVTIKGPRSTATFHDVSVTAHDVRPDVFRPGVVTALDVLLSLGEQGKLTGLDLTWHAMLDGIENVDHYMVDWISTPDALGEKDSLCGYMDEAATEGLRPFLTPHSHATTEIHLSSDLELFVSPEYVEWQWLCATS